MGKLHLFSAWRAEDWARASVVVLLVTWLPSMLVSLSLDELGTYWTVSGSLSDTVVRATDFQGQSPFTYVLMWAWNTLLSPSDFGLRVLPVLLGLGTFAGLYSIAHRIAGRSAAWFSVAASVSQFDFRLVLVNLRPYAFALFFLVWSTRLLIAWVDGSNRFVAVGYVFASAASLWSVYYAVFAILGHVIFVLVRRQEDGRKSLGRFTGMVAAIVFLCLPLVPQLVSLQHRAPSLQFAGLPPLRVILDALLPSGMLGAWVIVVVVAGVPKLPSLRRSERYLITWLLLAPSVMLYSAARFAGLGQWVQRYRSPLLLGFVLIASIWIAGYESDRKRSKAVLALVISGLLISPPAGFYVEDWRGALAYADAAISSDQLVILNSGFIEAASYEFLADPVRSKLLAAPLSRYPVRQDVLLSPTLPAREAFPYLACAIDVKRYDEIAVVTLEAGPLTFEGFDQVLQGFGYEEIDYTVFAGVQVHVFRRFRDSRIEWARGYCAETAKFQAQSP